MESLQQKEHQPIPVDLIIEILSRLTSTPIARFRCLSKLWDSILRSQDFTDTFLARSLARPQLLFACGNDDGNLFFFSSPQKSSSIAAANYHMNFPCARFDNVRHVNGLVCFKDNAFALKIFNPSTGQCLTLPEIKTHGRWMRTFLGCDAIEKQVKVLTITGEHEGNAISDQHQVLTLETDKMSWRTIHCGIPHFPISGGVCINGVLYYIATEDSMIVCFDVRSEKYTFIRARGAVDLTTNLINYRGKLASLGFYGNDEAGKSFYIWVLQDPESQVWLKFDYRFPIETWSEGRKDESYSVGVTGKSEILFFPDYVSDPFYVFYYNLERKTIRRSEIRGMRKFKGKKVFTFLDHKDMKLI
ncbi:F-box protein DOR [Raphanus sativus]|nr:F-box protein DOR [Raphanus sativus]